MQKSISQFLLIVIGAFCIVNPTTIFAQAVLNITAESTIANLNLTGISTVTYTVVNSTKHPINQLTVDPTYSTTGNVGGISLLNNHCAGLTLPQSGRCTFQILLTNAVIQPTVFFLRPRVCGYNGAVCSVPLATDEVQVSSSPNVVFITNFGNNTLSVCNVNSDGTYGTCTQMQDPTFDGPSGVTLNAIGVFVDVANYNNNSVSICPLSSNGNLGACTSFQDPTFNGPTSIKSNYAIDYVYVTNYNNDTVSVCSIIAPGVVGPCTASSQSFASPNTIALNTKGTFAYVTNHANDTVSVCPINSNGTFATCVASNPGATFHGPTGININPEGTFAYISNSQNVGGNRSLSVCPINPDGSINTCSSYVSSLFNGNNFGKIRVNPAGTLLYVVNQTNNYVTLCSLSSNGSINTCSRLFPNGTFNSPEGIGN
jgi:DNA-binding beta-propeller fold protein YncE